MKSLKPVTHTLEIRIRSMRNDPVAQIEAGSTFQSFAVGDKFHHNMFDTSAWHDLPKEGEVFFIVDKAHAIADIGTCINHLVILCLAAAPPDQLS
ncbi:MAG: hypothetical protein WAW35_00630 [Sideroxyarcus sp.]|jgi:hypothetical protein|nr:hypothetical protein [uncultured Aquabacterium sp.]|tara:strand:- start:1190 stop:1474 length:285 start_codon:yes stop_codon:yes gene_type:complete